MKLSQVIAIPALALAAGLGLAACGSATAPAAAPAVTHSATAPAAAAKPTTPAPTAAAPAPAKTVYVQAPAAPAAAPEPAYFTNSTAVVQQFYQDISNGNYPGAWALGGDHIGGGDYAGWVAGYDSTVSVSLGTFSAFGSAQVQASLSALQVTAARTLTKAPTPSRVALSSPRPLSRLVDNHNETHQARRHSGYRAYRRTRPRRLRATHPTPAVRPAAPARPGHRQRRRGR